MIHKEKTPIEISNGSRKCYFWLFHGEGICNVKKRFRECNKEIENDTYTNTCREF